MRDIFTKHYENIARMQAICNMRNELPDVVRDNKVYYIKNNRMVCGTKKEYITDCTTCYEDMILQLVSEIKKAQNSVDSEYYNRLKYIDVCKNQIYKLFDKIELLKSQSGEV